ncbi:hypothetical protein KDA_09230 [Dictyobacter alpinus]|uniref:Uncharacterized protein n=1 Tax=Dictyobacter alpinus TaxID=2014873 RepID=A0A402B272_9CHLR|nr:peptidase dimerization domain-containing protein [Dictyobacter alpinus]GCE25439.1 hypothetical protein KDA_09230 [Dictyobacter alpinus]
MAFSSMQQILFQAIDDQFPSNMNAWQNISHQCYTSPDTKIQELFFPLLHRNGFSVQYLDLDQQILYAEYMVQAPQTLLFCLQDTPQASAQQVVFPLFSQMAALRAYIHSSGQLPVNIKWLIMGQGPTTSTSLAQLLSEQTQLFQADGCILYTTKREISKVIDQTELILGIKGHLAVKLFLKVAEKMIPASYGSIAPDAAWQLLWLLGSVKSAHEEVLLENFYDSLLPAEDEILEALARLPDTTKDLTTSWGLSQLLLGLEGSQQHYAHFLTPSCNITMLESNTIAENDKQKSWEGSLPSQASAQLDFYLLPGQDPYAIFTKLEQHLHSQTAYELQCQLLTAQHPIYTSVHTHLVQRIQQTLIDVYQQPPLLLPSTSGTFPYALLANRLSIPTISLAPPLLSTADTEHVYQQLNQSMKQNILFIASMDD